MSQDSAISGSSARLLSGSQGWHSRYSAERGAVPFLTGYQVNRILAFINPGKFADLNVQQDNSKMAIGSGMLYGKGLLNETAISVKNGNFLSEEHTDFIFAVIGEEMGFAGAACLCWSSTFSSYLNACEWQGEREI